jgi:dienelactone hydrolase
MVNRSFCRSLLVLLLAVVASPAAGQTIGFVSKTEDARWSAEISGELRLPGKQGPYPLVIFLPPCGGLTGLVRQTFAVHAAALHKAGFATFTLDSFGARGISGLRACKPPLGPQAVRFVVDDAFNAKALLAKREAIDGANIFLAGLSLGAVAAVRAATQGMHLHAPPFKAVVAYYPACHSVRQGVLLLSPLLIFGAGNDDWTPVDGCVRAKENTLMKGAEFDVVVYPGALHGFDQPRPRFRLLGHWLGHHPAAAADSRKRMAEFFLKHRTN